MKDALLFLLVNAHSDVSLVVTGRGEGDQHFVRGAGSVAGGGGRAGVTH